MEMGGRDHAFLCIIAVRFASAVNMSSDWPWNRGILQMCFEGTSQHPLPSLNDYRLVLLPPWFLEYSRHLLPDNRVLGRNVFCFACGHGACHPYRVERCWDVEHDIVGIQLGWKVGLDQDPVVDLRLANLCHNWMDFEG